MRLVHHQFFQLNYFPALLLFNLLFHLFREGERKRSSTVFLLKFLIAVQHLVMDRGALKSQKESATNLPHPALKYFLFYFYLVKYISFFLWLYIIHISIFYSNSNYFHYLCFISLWSKCSLFWVGEKRSSDQPPPPQPTNVISLFLKHMSILSS